MLITPSRLTCPYEMGVEETQLVDVRPAEVHCDIRVGWQLIRIIESLPYGNDLLDNLKLQNRLSLARPKGSMKLKAISFGLVGVVNTFIDLGVFSIAWIFFGLSPLLANLVAWFLAVSGSYFINCFTTFAAESGRRVALRTYAGFIGAGVAGLVVGTAVLLVAKMFLPVLAAKLLAIVASFAINFSMSHLVVFSSVRPE